MALNAGERLGPYEIVSPIGAGGMGEVWKARDTRLNRTVAVKVSKVEFTQRFEREARIVAALNHPRICQLYDVGPNYIVMEFIEGAPLKGPLPLGKAIEYGAQILDALDAAHKKGIIHRDLKPGNILLTREGVKLLDFGLAKQAAGLKATDSTLTNALTGNGQLSGTLCYMAPEQLQGREADARSDLFAFGCVLYEMLAGERAFDGASAADVIAAILGHEPAPLESAGLLGRILLKCLAKDPDERFQTARDLKTNLTWASEKPPDARRPAGNRRWFVAIPAVILAALGGWAAARHWVASAPTDLRVIRFTIPPPENTKFQTGKISPDGRWLAFIGIDTSGKQQLWVRKLDSIAAQAPTAAGRFPFWSADSRFIAYLQDGKLKKIAPSGGAPQVICDAGLVVGGAWSRDGIIIFSDGETILQAPSRGDPARQLTRLDRSRKETAHDFPSFLPDGRHFLYTIHSEKRENGGIYLGSLDSPDARVRLLEDTSNAEYAPAFPPETSFGYVLFARGNVLTAQRLGLANLQLQGGAVPVVEKIVRSATNLSASFSASNDGVLLVSSPIIGDQLTWFDRTGQRLGTVGSPGLHFYPQLSPDEHTLAVDSEDAATFSSYLWLFPVARGAPSRFTFSASLRPVWSRDGGAIAFEDQSSALYLKTSAGTENQRLLLEAAHIPDDYRLPCDWSKDGKLLIYSERNRGTKYGLWMLPVIGDHKPISLLHTEFNVGCGALSPDGRWIAYSLDETGRNEIYVQAFSAGIADSGRKWQVSYNGGTWPKWRGDGKELFYVDAALNMTAVEMNAGPTNAGAPKSLFSTGMLTPDARFDVTSDGRRFLVPTEASESNVAPPLVIINWTKAIQQ